MADRDQTPIQPRSAPQPRAPQASPATDAVEALQRIAAAAPSDGPGQDQTGGNAGDEARGSSSSAEDTIEVEFKGARKRVPVKDLVSQAMKAEELEMKHKVLEEVVQKNAAAAAFVKVIDGMAPEDQEAFKAVLANPRLARQLTQQRPPQRDQETEVEDEIIENLNGIAQPKQRAAQPPQDDVVRQTLSVLLEDYRQRRAAQETQTLEQKIESAMNPYQGFQALEPEGRRFAREAISNAVARNPNAKLDDVVAQHAANYERMLMGRRAPEAVGAPPRTFQPSDPGKQFTGEDLANGDIGRRLLADFRNMLR